MPRMLDVKTLVAKAARASALFYSILLYSIEFFCMLSYCIIFYFFYSIILILLYSFLFRHELKGATSRSVRAALIRTVVKFSTPRASLYSGESEQPIVTDFQLALATKSLPEALDSTSGLRIHPNIANRVRPQKPSATAANC